MRLRPQPPRTELSDRIHVGQRVVVDLPSGRAVCEVLEVRADPRRRLITLRLRRPDGGEALDPYGYGAEVEVAPPPGA